ncbi:MAG: hypothetical protein GXY83_25250 [Rhodopirellula sp.]|nr:hypothetical protein [Rhodopirellula sp.]
MRILACNEGESIVIGEQIVVSVTEIGEDEVCLKIEGATALPSPMRTPNSDPGRGAVEGVGIGSRSRG